MKTLLKSDTFQMILMITIPFVLAYLASCINNNLILPAMWSGAIMIYELLDKKEGKYVRDDGLRGFVILKGLAFFCLLSFMNVGISELQDESRFNKFVLFPILLLIAYKTYAEVLEYLETLRTKKEVEVAEVSAGIEGCEEGCLCEACMKAADEKDLEDSLDFIRKKYLYAEFREFQDLRKEARGD